MATGGEDSSEVENVGEAYGLIKLPEATRPNDFAYRFTNTNTTILYYWSSSLSDLEPLNKANPDSKIAMRLPSASFHETIPPSVGCFSYQYRKSLEKRKVQEKSVADLHKRKG
jgi:hypothetical protein